MPSLGVNIAIIRKGQILLTKREDFEVWCLPGGEVDDGESVAQAALRETREETGLEVLLTRLVGVYSRPRVRLGTHIILFAALPVGGALWPQAGEVLEVRYFSLHEIPAALLTGQRQCIHDALNGSGGGVAWLHDFVWPFPPEMTRQEIYALRDRSGLSRQEFYLSIVAQSGPGTDRLEVGGGETETRDRDERQRRETETRDRDER